LQPVKVQQSITSIYLLAYLLGECVSVFIVYRLSFTFLRKICWVGRKTGPHTSSHAAYAHYVHLRKKVVINQRHFDMQKFCTQLLLGGDFDGSSYGL